MDKMQESYLWFLLLLEATKLQKLKNLEFKFEM